MKAFIVMHASEAVNGWVRSFSDEEKAQRFADSLSVQCMVVRIEFDLPKEKE